MRTIAIKDLRPTQCTHGLREISRKMRFYQSLSGHALDMAIAEKPVPIVLGPGNLPFAIDHHHVAAALRLAGIRSMPFVLAADLSSLSYQEFWLSMEDRRWTHPYDAKGRRKSFAEMPARIWKLEDDAFRSLAASVRDAGGYEKTTTPLAEFRWADLFRTVLRYPKSEREYAAVERQAIKLARSNAAAGLPGYMKRVGR